MAWLSRVNFTASDVLSYTDLNNLGNDIRAWGGNVNGGGYTLSNVVLSASSGTMATVIGGTGTTSTLTLRSTSGVGTTGADIIFQTGNNGATEVMRLQNGGNVGIGTSGPDALLTVNTIASFGDGAVTTPSIAHKGDLNTGFWFPAADVIATSTAGSERMRIDSSGNVGIGTSSPSFLLDLYKASLPEMRINDGVTTFQCYVASGVVMGTASNHPIVFRTNGSERMRIDSSGNVGIGTSSPGYLLDLYKANLPEMRINDGVTTFQCYVASGVVMGTASTHPIVFRTNTTERMRIDSSGNVKIGGTADRATTAGAAHLDIFNGTAPAGTLANGISIYSSSGEAYVMDAAGNATLFSPHDRETNEWIFDSTDTRTGKRLKINVERLLRFINDHFGLDCVHDLMEEA